MKWKKKQQSKTSSLNNITEIIKRNEQRIRILYRELKRKEEKREEWRVAANQLITGLLTTKCIYIVIISKKKKKLSVKRRREFLLKVEFEFINLNSFTLKYINVSKPKRVLLFLKRPRRRFKTSYCE